MSVIANAAAIAPTKAAVYFFLDEHHELIYVGKAGNLRHRLQQHAKAAEAAATARDTLRHELVAHVRWEECANADAAAAREADLIVALRPLLNGSHATDGRWVYIVVVTDPGSETCRLQLTETITGAAGRHYGCFPHIGTGVSSRRAIACSEGYASLLRLLWAACEADASAPYPSAIVGPSPPRDATLPFADRFARDLHRLLAGTSARLLDELLVAADRRPAFMLPALRRDQVGAAAFFDHGPRAVRELRLRHHRPPGPVSRADIESLLASEVRAVIGDFRLPVLDDPTGGVLGDRASRAHATRAALRRRRV